MSGRDETNADVLAGCAVLLRALSKIGTPAEENGDRELAKVIVDGELQLRALVAFAIDEVSP